MTLKANGVPKGTSADIFKWIDILRLIFLSSPATNTRYVMILRKALICLKSAATRVAYHPLVAGVQRRSPLTAMTTSSPPDYTAWELPRLIARVEELEAQLKASNQQ